MARRFHAHVLELVLALTEPGEAKSFAIPLIPPAPFLLEPGIYSPPPLPLVMGLECCFNDQIILPHQDGKHLKWKLELLMTGIYSRNLSKPSMDKNKDEAIMR